MSKIRTDENGTALPVPEFIEEPDRWTLPPLQGDETMNTHNINAKLDDKIDAASSAAKDIAGEVCRKTEDLDKKGSQKLQHFEEKVSEAVQHAGHRVQTAAQSAGHHVQEFAGSFSHRAQEAAHKVGDIAKEMATKAEHKLRGAPKKP